LHIYIKFCSFYKINSSLEVLNLHNKNNVNINIPKHTSEYSTNIKCSSLLIFIVLFNNLISSSSFQKINIKSARGPIGASIFILPIKKKNVIFLRAPYKNKLARLNILRRRYSATIAIKYNLINPHSDNNYLIKLITWLKNLNFSTHYIKHHQTKMYFISKNTENFLFSNFN